MNPQTECSILRVPGEIRVMIYKAILAGNNPIEIEFRPEAARAEKKDKSRSQKSTKDFKPTPITIRDPPNSSALGLAQTCKLFQAEYLGVYFEAVDISVHLDDLNRFSQTFLNAGRIGRKKAFTIILPKIDGSHGPNILPLVRWKLQNQGFTISFKSKHNMQILTNIINNDKKNLRAWLKSVRKSSGVYLVCWGPSWSDQMVHFVVKH